MNVLLSDSGLQIGTHVPFEKNLTKTATFALSFGMFSFQFFMGSPQSSKRTKIEDDDISKFLKLKDRFPINCFTHAPYIYNLANSDKNIKSLATLFLSIKSNENDSAIDSFNNLIDT